MVGGPGAEVKLNGIFDHSKRVEFFGYAFICEILTSNETLQKSIDDNKHIATIVAENKEDDEQYIFTYGTTRLAAEYVLFAVKHNLSGIGLEMGIHNDDPTGLCELDSLEDTWYSFNRVANNSFPEVPQRVDNKFPFSRTINEAFYKATKVNQTSDPTPGSASSFTCNPLYVALILLGIVLSSVF